MDKPPSPRQSKRASSRSAAGGRAPKRSGATGTSLQAWNTLIAEIDASAVPPLTEPQPEPGHDRLVQSLLFGFLLWDSDHARATRAMQRLLSEAVDLNDVRVMRDRELVAAFGRGYSKPVERAHRLLDALGEVHRRERVLRLDALATARRQAAADYLASLPGMVGFVASRVLLAAGHDALPIDDRLRLLLIDRGVGSVAIDADTLAASLSASIEPGRHARVSELVLAWAEQQPMPRLPPSIYGKSVRVSAHP